MSNALFPNADLAIAFLQWLSPEVPMYFESMFSEGPARPAARRFSLGDVDAAEAFVHSSNSPENRKNLYFLPNAEFLNGARKKDNLTGVRFLHVDLDFKDYVGPHTSVRDKVLGMLIDEKYRPKGVPEPSGTWFTGGGYQAIWRLVEPMSIEQGEKLNHALLNAFQGGPGTHNADRLLRLPGSVNWLNDKKRKDGRSPDISAFIHPGFKAPVVSYLAADFTLKTSQANLPAPHQTPKPAKVLEIEPLPLPDDLGEILPADPKWVEVIVTGQNPADKSYKSRSELVFASVLWLLGRSIDPGYVLSILLDSEFGISAHVLEKSNALNYARRQISKAMDKIEAERNDWPALDKSEFPIANLPDNIRHALKKVGVDARRNMFTNADEITGQSLEGRDLNDVADILSSMFSRELQFVAAPPAISRELISLAHEQPFHPILDYLEALKWDGVQRIDKWLRDYCGAADTELNEEFGSKLLIAGVRRLKQPGVKFDTMLVLEGPQGGYKSSLIAKLAVREEWFCGSLDLKSDDKNKAELLARAWIVECQELDGLSKATSESLKKFLSTNTDAYRKAYARDSGLYKRHCIIIGTTNDNAYLRDLTGNRRIWPVRIGKVNIDAFVAVVDQLWAEAMVREATDSSIVLSEHLWVAAANIQKDRMVVDPFADTLEDAFAGKSGRVSLESVKLLIGIDTYRMSANDARRIKSILAGLGWEASTYRLHDLGGGEYAPRKGFARGSPEERKIEHVAERTSQGPWIIKRKASSDDTEMPF